MDFAFMRGDFLYTLYQLFLVEAAIQLIVTRLMDIPDGASIENPRYICSVQKKGCEAEAKQRLVFFILKNRALFLPCCDVYSCCANEFYEFFRPMDSGIPKSIDGPILVVYGYFRDMPLKQKVESHSRASGIRLYIVSVDVVALADFRNKLRELIFTPGISKW